MTYPFQSRPAQISLLASFSRLSLSGVPQTERRSPFLPSSSLYTRRGEQHGFHHPSHLSLFLLLRLLGQVDRRNERLLQSIFVRLRFFIHALTGLLTHSAHSKVKPGTLENQFGSAAPNSRRLAGHDSEPSTPTSTRHSRGPSNASRTAVEEDDGDDDAASPKSKRRGSLGALAGGIGGGKLFGKKKSQDDVPAAAAATNGRDESSESDSEDDAPPRKAAPPAKRNSVASKNSKSNGKAAAVMDDSSSVEYYSSPEEDSASDESAHDGRGGGDDSDSQDDNDVAAGQGKNRPQIGSVRPKRKKMGKPLSKLTYDDVQLTDQDLRTDITEIWDAMHLLCVLSPALRLAL